MILASRRARKQNVAAFLLGVSCCLAGTAAWAQEVPPDSATAKAMTPMRADVKADRAARAARKERQAAVANKLSPTERSEKELDAFLKVGGLSIAELNRPPQAPLFGADGSPIAYPVFLLQVLVDSAYSDHEPELITAARQRGIDFASNGVAALLSRIVGLDKPARMRAIVDALASVPYTPEEAKKIGTYLYESKQATRRYMTHVLAILPSSAAGPGVMELKRCLKGLPEIVPTPTDTQGPTGRWNAKTRVYFGPAPERIPALVAGQTFLCLPDYDDLLLTDTVTGKPVSRAAYTLKTLTLQAAEPGKAVLYDGETVLRLRFTLEGYANPVVWEGDGDLYDLPNLCPLTEDETVRDLRVRYLNKHIWGYGGLVGVATVMANPQEHLSLTLKNDPHRGGAVVRRIFRLRSGSPFWLTIGMAPAYSDESKSRFTTREPLIVLLELPAGVPYPSSSSSVSSGFGEGDTKEGAEAIAGLERNDLRSIKTLAYYATFADAWDFEREYSLISLEQASKKWPAKYRRAGHQQVVIRGMTPEMVAWVMGFPDKYGTRKDLLQTPGEAWGYGDVPFNEQAIFFKNGRVSGSYQSPMLP